MFLVKGGGGSEGKNITSTQQQNALEPVDRGSLNVSSTGELVGYDRKKDTEACLEWKEKLSSEPVAKKTLWQIKIITQ